MATACSSSPARSNAPTDEAGDGPERTEDGRYVVIDGRRWRATDPSLPEARRKELVSELMSARSAVGWAKRRGDSKAERAARDRVQAAKEGLGERGAKWWEQQGR